MKIKYIFGNNKSNKTSTVIKMAKEFQQKGESTVVIVPEQMNLTMEKRLIDELESILNVQVYSFVRLSDKIFQESGIRNLVNLEDTGKFMLLKLIITKNQKNLKYYKNGINKNGFIFELADFLSELHRDLITIKDIDNILDSDNVSETIKFKLHDVKIILNDYNNYIKSRYISSDEVLDLLALRLCESTYLKDINVIIDGFYGLTNQEYNVIDKLMKVAKSLTITFNVNVNKKIVYFENLNKFDPYFDPKKTINNITDIVKENNHKIDDIILLEDFKSEKEDLKFLKENFLKYKIENVYDEMPDNIEINVAKNKVYEVEYLAKKIIDFTNNGYEFKDINVVCGNLNGYSKIISSVLTEYDIPFFIDVKDDILLNSLTLIIKGVLHVLLNNYSFESVLNLLKINMFYEGKFTTYEIEVFENYLLEYGIKGYQFKSEFLKGADNKKYNLEEINYTRTKFLNALSSFDELSINFKKHSVREFLTKLYDFLEQNEITYKIEQIIENASKDHDLKRKKEYEQIWDKYIKLFEKMNDILGEEKVNVKEFSEIMSAGIDSETLGMIPLSINEVTIGDSIRSKFSMSKIVLLIGANDDSFPSRPEEKSIINDLEREHIKPFVKSIKTSNELSLKENLLIFDALLTGSEKIMISYPLYTFDGTLLNVSSLIKKIKTLFPNIAEKSDNTIYMTNKKTMLVHTISLLKKQNANEELSEDEKNFLEFYEQDEIYKDKIKILRKEIEGKMENQILSKAIIESIYSNSMETSISKLEKYAKCPFSYFLEYNLYLKTRKTSEIKNVDIGSVFHEILDRFIKSIEIKGVEFSKVEDEYINDEVDKIITQLKEENFLYMFDNSFRYNYYLERIASICKKSIFALSRQLERGQFEIFGTELSFGSKDISKIVIDLGDDKNIVLTGKVDRIDVYEDGEKRYVKIIDYKSSSKKFDENEVLQGTQLQLMTYLDVILNKGNEIFKSDTKFTYLPGGVYYFEIQNPKISDDSRLDVSEIKQKIFEKFKLSGVSNDEIEVLNKIDKNIETNLKSDVVNVRLKKDGTAYSNSEVFSEEKFDEMRENVNEKIKELGNKILNGDIEIDYDKAEKLKACNYCDFSGICKRDKPVK